MDYSEKKKKIPFDFNTENVVLQIIFQMNVLLRGLYKAHTQGKRT